MKITESEKTELVQQASSAAVGLLIFCWGFKEEPPPPRTTLMKEFEDLHYQAVLETAVILKQGIWVQDFFLQFCDVAKPVMFFPIF